MATTVKILLDITDRGSAPLRLVGQAARETGAEVTKAQRPVQLLSGGLADLGGGFKSFVAGALQVTAGGLIQRGMEGLLSAVGDLRRSVINGSISAATDFGQQMSAVQAVSLATAAEMDQLSAAALRIGKETSFGATEAASAMEMLVANGIAVTDVLSGAADATVALAAATGADLETAAAVGSDAMNIFGISAAEMSRAIDGISGVTVASKFDINDYALALAQGGGVAKAAGVSFADFNTTITAISPLFASGSDAGTSFKTMLTALIPKSGDAAQMMSDLGLVSLNTAKATQLLGISSTSSINEIVSALQDYVVNVEGVERGTKAWEGRIQELWDSFGQNQFYETNGSMKSMAEVAGLLQGALANLSDEQRNNALATIFGSDASRAAAALAEVGAEKFNALALSIGEVDAAAQAATRLDNLAGDMDALTGSLETAGIQFGTAFTPLLREATQAAEAFVSSNLIDRDWTPLVEALDTVAYGVQGIIALFTDAPLYEDNPVAYALRAIDDAQARLQPGLDWLTNTGLPAVRGGLAWLSGTGLPAVREGWSWLIDTGLPAARGGFDQVAGVLESRLTPILGDVLDATRPVVDGFSEGGLRGALGALPGALGPVLSSVGDLRTRLIALALDGVAGLTNRLADDRGFRSFLGSVGLSDRQVGDITGTLHSLASILETAGGWVIQVGTWLQDRLLPPVIEAGRGFAEMLLPHLRWLADFGNEHVMPFLRDIGSFLGANLPGVIRVVTPLLTGLVDIGLSAVELALMGIATTWETYLKPVFATWGGWLQELTGGWDNLARGAGRVKDTMTDIAQAIRDIAAGRVDFSQIFSGLGELGRMLGVGGGAGLMGDSDSDGQLSRTEWLALNKLIGQPGGPATYADWRALPHLAGGARGFGGGLALVGELGPELVDVPRGANVYSASETTRILASAGETHYHLHLTTSAPAEPILQDFALLRAMGGVGV